MNTLSQADLDAFVRSTPEIGLQTYEFFNGAKETREEAKTLFIDGANYLPKIDYPLLDEEVIAQKYDALKTLHQLVSLSELDGLSLQAYEGIVGYRLREAGFLLQACILNDETLDEDTFQDQSNKHQKLNEHLYGFAEPAFIDGVVEEIGNMTREIEYSGMAKDIYDEVTESLLPQIYSGDFGHILPSLTEEARTYLLEMIEKRFFVEKKCVEIVREKIVSEGRTEFEPTDMLVVFEDIISERGYQDFVNVFMSPGKTLAWSSERAGVMVGESRSPVELAGDMYGFTIHEEAVHGQRYVNGITSEIPILGSGLFNYDDEGSTNYLAFEEGLATLYQRIADGTLEGWTMDNFKHTLNLAFAYKGKDFREVYESCWRIYALLDAKEGTLDYATIAKSKSLAYDSVLRIFRGTPLVRSSRIDQVVTYNKDSAYLPGRVSAINFWNANAGNDTMFDFVLAGKFDPTNKVQRAIAHTATRGIYE